MRKFSYSLIGILVAISMFATLLSYAATISVSLDYHNRLVFYELCGGHLIIVEIRDDNTLASRSFVKNFIECDIDRSSLKTILNRIEYLKTHSQKKYFGFWEHRVENSSFSSKQFGIPIYMISIGLSVVCLLFVIWFRLCGVSGNDELGNYRSNEQKRG